MAPGYRSTKTANAVFITSSCHLWSCNLNILLLIQAGCCLPDDWDGLAFAGVHLVSEKEKVIFDFSPQQFGLIELLCNLCMLLCTLHNQAAA
jgi:hypothetical protein